MITKSTNQHSHIQTNNHHQADVYRDVNELAQALGVSRLTVYSGLRNGVIPHVRLGRLYILPRSAIALWLRTAGGQLKVSA